MTIIASVWTMAISGAIAALAALELVRRKEAYDFERAWSREQIDARYNARHNVGGR